MGIFDFYGDAIKDDLNNLGDSIGGFASNTGNQMKDNFLTGLATNPLGQLLNPIRAGGNTGSGELGGISGLPSDISSFISKLVSHANGASNAGQRALKAGINASANANKKKGKKKKGGGSPFVDPNALLNSIYGSSSYNSANDKEYKKRSQKAINEALLSARKPYDAAIVGERRDLARNMQLSDRDTAAFQNMMRGAQMGSEALGEKDVAAVQEAATRDAGNVKSSVDELVSRLGLGEAPNSTSGLSAADDLAMNKNESDARAASGDATRAANSGVAFARDLGLWSGANKLERKDKLRRDSASRVSNLRSQRGLSMSQARGALEAELAKQLKENEAALQDSAYKRAQLALDAARMQNDGTLALMKMKQGAANDTQDSITMKQKLALEELKNQQKNSLSTLGMFSDAFASGLFKKRPDDLASLGQSMGIDPSVIAALTGQKASNVGGVPSLGGLFGNAVKGWW